MLQRQRQPREIKETKVKKAPAKLCELSADTSITISYGKPIKDIFYLGERRGRIGEKERGRKGERD